MRVSTYPDRQISTYSGLRSIVVVPTCFVSIMDTTTRRMRIEKARMIEEPVIQMANKTIAMILEAEHFRRFTRTGRNAFTQMARVEVRVTTN